VKTKPFAVVFVVCMLLQLSSAIVLAAPPDNKPSAPRPEKLRDSLREQLRQKAADEIVRVVLRLEPLEVDGVREDFVIPALKAHAEKTQKRALGLLQKRGARVVQKLWLVNAVVAEVKVNAVYELTSLPEVREIHEDFTVKIIEPVRPTHELRFEELQVGTLQASVTWGLSRIGAPSVWALGLRGEGIRVAVLDTGADISHPDLAGKMWTDNPADPYYPGGWIHFDGAGNIVASTPYDSDQHGTHCSGTVLGGEASGTAIGVAPNAKLMHALILPGGSGTFTQVVAGMQWAVNPFDRFGNPAGQRAHVASMSFGAYGYHDAMIEPIRNMKAAGVVPVAAIGNAGVGTTGSPGNVYEAFGIGATAVDNTVASFSSGGTVNWPASYPQPYIKPDFSAPGVAVYSSIPGGSWASWQGTSMATPHVAGTVALILQSNPTLSVDDIYYVLKTTADDYPPTGQDDRYGWGIADAYEAVTVAGLKSGIRGYVKDNSTLENLAGVAVTVTQTGQVGTTAENGYYKMFVPPGTYTLTATKFGYYDNTIANVSVVADQWTTLDILLAPKPKGTIVGKVTDNSVVPENIAGATVAVVNTPLSATTDNFGDYTIENVPVDNYTLRTSAWGYKSKENANVEVLGGQTTTVNFALEPTFKVAVLGDFSSQLTKLLTDNELAVREMGWEVVSEIQKFDVIVINLVSDPGLSTIENLIQAAEDNSVGLVFTSSWPAPGEYFWLGEYYGITLLQKYFNDPPEQSNDYLDGVVYYRVADNNHPIFTGWAIDDNVRIISGGWQDYAWFMNYSGQKIGDIGAVNVGVRGSSVAFNVRGNTVHLLLAGLAPQPWTNVPHWTENGKLVFLRGIRWAAQPELSGIRGYVKDNGTLEPLPGVSVSIPNQVVYSKDNGYYWVYAPPKPENYTVVASKFGYYDNTIANVPVLANQWTTLDITLALKPKGTITGVVTDNASPANPIENALVSILNTPLSKTTAADGSYTIENVPVDNYTLRTSAWGYKSKENANVEVLGGQTTTVNFALEPTIKVAILGDYSSQLTNLLTDNLLSVREVGWDVVQTISDYDVVVVNNPPMPGQTTFMNLIQAADNHSVGLVFTSSWPAGQLYGIGFLWMYLNDPKGHRSSYYQGEVYFRVVREHPIFEGWTVGTNVPIIPATPWGDYSWFWRYSGLTIGDIGAANVGIRGTGVAFTVRENGNIHLLLAGLAPQVWTNVTHWKENAKTILTRGVRWASTQGMYVSISQLEGEPGTALSITGSRASGTVELYWGDTLVESKGVNPDGTFSFSFTIPLAATAGTYSLVVREVPSGRYGGKTFTVLPRFALSPTSGLAGATVTASGSNFAANAKFNVMFRDSLVASGSIGSDGSFTTTFTVPSLPAGEYPVVAYDNTGNYTIKTFTISSPPAPTPGPAPGPAPGAKITAAAITLPPALKKPLVFYGWLHKLDFSDMTVEADVTGDGRIVIEVLDNAGNVVATILDVTMVVPRWAVLKTILGEVKFIPTKAGDQMLRIAIYNHEGERVYENFIQLAIKDVSELAKMFDVGAEVMPGGVVPISLVLKNDTDEPLENILVTFEIPRLGIRITRIVSLGAGESIRLEESLSIPPGTEAGQYEVQVNVGEARLASAPLEVASEIVPPLPLEFILGTIGVIIGVVIIALLVRWMLGGKKGREWELPPIETFKGNAS